MVRLNIKINIKIHIYNIILTRNLIVTLRLGRNSSRKRVLMVSTSSRAKSNNIVAGNKLNSDFRKSYAGRHGEEIGISAVEKQLNSRFLSTDPWPTPKTTGRNALMMMGISEMDSPASNCVRNNS